MLFVCFNSIAADSTAIAIPNKSEVEKKTEPATEPVTELATDLEAEPVIESSTPLLNAANAKPLPSKEFRPELGTGLGYYQFLGDVRTTDSRSHFASSVVYSFYAARRITDWLDFGLRYSTGVMVGAETGPERYLNFKSIIHEGSGYFAYDFSNLFQESKILKPYFSIGLSFFEFNNKGDLYDANGNEYHYWNDGSIRTAAENSTQAANAVKIQRDYVYETDLRKADLDGFGRYTQMGFGIPVGLELEFNVSSRFSFRMGSIYTYALTDLLDNVTENSTGNRAGEKGGDHYLQHKLSVHYDLFNKLRKVEIEDFEFVDYLALDIDDDDKDKVINEFDLCPYTLKDVDVDAKGCPKDIDEDGIADFLDEDNGTELDSNVNEQGIALDADDYLYWYMKYIDSLNVPKEVLERIAGKRQRPARYRVFLKEFEEGELIVDEVLDQFSFESDINVFTDKNKKTIYTAGEYSSQAKAEERKNKLIEQGIKDAQVVVFDDDDEMMKADDWNKLAGRQMDDRFKESLEKVKNLDGMFAVKLGSSSVGANSMDKAKYLQDPKVLMLAGGQETIDYIIGPFIDTVAAAQSVIDYEEKGFSNAKVVKISNGKAVQPEAITEEDNIPLSNEELGDFAKLKELDGLLLVKVGTVDKKTTLDERQKLLSEPGLVSVTNSDKSVDFMYEKGYMTKASARDKKAAFIQRGFANPKLVKLFVQKRELRPLMKEELNNKYAILLGSYKKGIPDQEVDRILSVSDARQVESYDPSVNNYIVGVYENQEEAKERILELAFQGFNTRVVKYEGDQVLPAESLPMFDSTEQKIINSSKSAAAIMTDQAVFRVHIGAFSTAIPAGKFKNVEVLSFKSPKGVTKYLTEGSVTYREAYVEKLRLKKSGFVDAFVVAHKDGKNIPLKDLVNDEEFKRVKEELGTGDFYERGDIVYKVQVGAFKDFSAEHSKLRGYENVEMEIYGDYKRVLTGVFYSYPEATEYKEKLVKEAGYTGAFVVAYSKGQRLSPTGVNPNVVELGEGGKDIIPERIPGLVIRVQIGLYRGAPPANVELMMAQLDEKLSKEPTQQGITRYMAGEFDDPMAATAYKQVLREKGFKGAFLVAYYNSNRIDIKKAIEMAKKNN
jgi:hypothetical protein